MSTPYTVFPINGMYYFEASVKKFRLIAAKERVSVTLKAMPKNKYDRWAVAVMWEGKQIGWIPRENQTMSLLLQAGFKPKCTADCYTVCVERLQLDQRLLAVSLQWLNEKAENEPKYGKPPYCLAVKSCTKCIANCNEALTMFALSKDRTYIDNLIKELEEYVKNNCDSGADTGKA